MKKKTIRLAAAALVALGMVVPLGKWWTTPTPYVTASSVHHGPALRLIG